MQMLLVTQMYENTVKYVFLFSLNVSDEAAESVLRAVRESTVPCFFFGLKTVDKVIYIFYLKWYVNYLNYIVYIILSSSWSLLSYNCVSLFFILH